ncbi:MAG: hypothetical protein ABSF03_21570 [Streptosporangiaceae bacterium]
MTDVELPSSDKARVSAAVALGWQVAKLYHSPVHQGPVADPRQDGRLPGFSGFSAVTHSKWLGEQIAATAARLVTAPPPALLRALGVVLGCLGTESRDRDAILGAIFTLHCRLLEALTVTDFRLGKAYGLGRALAETTLVPAASAADDVEGDFRELLGAGRIGTIKDWLVELKTLLPEHAAYAVSRGLDDWRDWAAAPPAPTDWRNAQTAMRMQGYLWRGLITGEKAAVDMLSLSGYLAAARQVARRAWWLILLTVGAAVAVVVAMVLLHGISPTTRLIAALAWLGGTLFAGLKASGALLGSAVKGAEGWLWQTELDESVAQAATRLPAPARHRRITGTSAGAMTLSEHAPPAATEMPAATSGR